MSAMNKAAARSKLDLLRELLAFTKVPFAFVELSRMIVRTLTLHLNLVNLPD